MAVVGVGPVIAEAPLIVAGAYRGAVAIIAAGGTATAGAAAAALLAVGGTVVGGGFIIAHHLNEHHLETNGDCAKLWLAARDDNHTEVRRLLKKGICPNWVNTGPYGVRRLISKVQMSPHAERTSRTLALTVLQYGAT